MIKGIIFDLDGTLLDTVEDIKDSLNHILAKNHFPILTTEQVKKNLGNGAKALVRASILEKIEEEKLNKVFLEYSNYYNINNNIKTKPYPFILELLETLKKENYLLAIVSNKDQSGVDTLNKNVFKGLIDVALGENKGVPLKPSPEAIYTALNQMGLTHEEVLYVGDTEVDMQTAQNAQLKSVAVTWGFRKKEDLNVLNPDYMVDHPLEILEILKR
ncbi:MAG: HAD family hydrolase [Candidatus Phytoplasma sp.]|nr:HAD family hydrolase [Phytoplasma sp.]